MTPSNKFEDLVGLISILRKECPWDRKQTPHSIKENLLEEAYEAVEAIDNNNQEELAKELGDVLLHVIFQSEMASEKQHFDIHDVIWNISEKLIRRHPHVFGDTLATDEKKVAENWETIKLKEGKNSVLDGVPKQLPGLIKAQRMQEKAANVGFDWNHWQLAWEKLDEELGEWKHSLNSQNRQEQREEFGDVLFSMVNVGRLMGLSAEDAIRNANNKFGTRFKYIERRLAENGKSVTESNLEEMDAYWNEAKKET